MEYSQEHVQGFPDQTQELISTLYQFQQQRYLCDVLIFTADGYVPAHRVVLVAASKYFREVEMNHTTQEANFYLKQEKSEDLQKIIELIYTGHLNISIENVVRVHSLCQTLGLETAEKECKHFIDRFSSLIKDDKKGKAESDKEQISLGQLESAVIDELEKSRSNNNTPMLISNEAETGNMDNDRFEQSEKSDIENTVKPKETTNNKQSKLKSKQKNKKANVENHSPTRKSTKPLLTEKAFSCGMCNETFQDKANLLGHRKSKHQNKRKPSHTKRYVPIDADSENSEIDEGSELPIDDLNDSSLSENNENILSTRQGTKRRTLENNNVQSKKDSKVICRLCKDEFESTELLLEHRSFLHPGTKRENLTCNICDKILSSWLNLVEHKYKKHNIGYDTDKYKSLMCEEPDCDFSTIVEYKLKTHYSDVHGEMGSHVCDICNKACKSVPQLKYHMRTTHSDDKNQLHHKCDQCGKSFRHLCNLKKHFDYVHLKIMDKKYLCHLCTYKCMSKTDLHNHLLKIHDIPLPKSCKVYKCDKCDYFTLTRSCYERHQMLHEDNGIQKSFMCSTCGKAFSNIQNVKAHEKRHKSEIMFCPIEGCGYSTKFKHTMKNHIAGMHTHKNVRPYQCHLCEYSCKLKGNLDKHLRGKHGVEVMTIPKLRQKAIETGKGFSDIVFPPRNCNEMPAKLADKHQLHHPQKSQELQDVTFPQLIEMAKKVSKEGQQESLSQNGDLLASAMESQALSKENSIGYSQCQNESDLNNIQLQSVAPIAMETDGYNHDHGVSLSNLNPVPLEVNKSTNKDGVYVNSHDIPVSYGIHHLGFENTDNSYSSRPPPAHVPQSNSVESYTAAMLSNFLNPKNGSQTSSHQLLPSMLSLNMQNYQSHGQPHPMILHHLMTHADSTGYTTTMSRSNSVPVEEEENFSSQLRPHSVDNMHYKTLSFQSQGQYSSNLTSADAAYQSELTSAQNMSPRNQRNYYPEIVIEDVNDRSKQAD